MSDTDVLIAGAGPTGLVLAFWLQRLGVRVRIVDKVAEPGTTSRALVLHARTMELYRQIGADLLCVPAAFTAYTGKAHWEVLLRARAIENQAYVLAPAQVGRIGPANENRFAWGHACIVDPWGDVLADAGGEQEGIAVAPIHPARLSQVRRDLPALQHRRRDVL